MDANGRNSNPQPDGADDSVRPTNYQPGVSSAKTSRKQSFNPLDEMTAQQRAEYKAWKRKLKPSEGNKNLATVNASSVNTSQSHIQSSGKENQVVRQAEMAVRHFFEQQFANDPEAKGAKIAAVKLTHVSGDNYTAVITIETWAETGGFTCDVHYNNGSFEISNGRNPQSKKTVGSQVTMLLLLTLLLGVTFWQIYVVTSQQSPMAVGGLAFCVACLIFTFVKLIKGF